MAKSPNRIGDVSNNKLCRIFDATSCSTCACDYYIKYSQDGGASWLGLTFGGTPGGSGCPGNGGASNQALALDWLVEEHIEKGRCGCDKENCKWTDWFDRDNPSGKGDYEFDPEQKNCKWTDWFDRDNPIGKGDYEFDPE